MFIGHFAVGLASKRAAPRTSLGLLITAPLVLDLLWPIFLLLGWEQVRIDPGNTVMTPLDFVSYPYSHSLLTSLVWGALFGGIYWMRTRYRAGAITLGCGVVSHWVCDAIVHRPDLPLVPGGGPMIGLGLWNSIPTTVLLEGALFITGLWVYMATTRARDGIGRFGLWGYAIVLLLLYVANLNGSPPPTPKAIAFVGLTMIPVFPTLAWWIDRHREVV